MPELLGVASREIGSFDLNPPLVSNLTTGQKEFKIQPRLTPVSWDYSGSAAVLTAH